MKPKGQTMGQSRSDPRRRQRQRQQHDQCQQQQQQQQQHQSLLEQNREEMRSRRASRSVLSSARIPEACPCAQSSHDDQAHAQSSHAFSTDRCVQADEDSCGRRRLQATKLPQARAPTDADVQHSTCHPSHRHRHRRLYRTPNSEIRIRRWSIPFLRVMLISAIVHQWILATSLVAASVESATGFLPLTLDCDPCIDRSLYQIRVILPASPSPSAETDTFSYVDYDWNALHWRQIRSAMDQLQSDFRIRLEYRIPTGIDAGSRLELTNYYRTQLQNAKQDYFIYQFEKELYDRSTTSSSDADSRRAWTRTRNNAVRRDDPNASKLPQTSLSDNQRIDALFIAIPPYQSQIMDMLYQDLDITDSLRATLPHLFARPDRPIVHNTVLPIFGFHSLPSYPSAIGVPLPQAQPAKATTDATDATTPADDVKAVVSSKLMSWIGYSDHDIGKLAMQTIIDRHPEANDMLFIATHRSIQNVNVSSSASAYISNLVQARLDGMDLVRRQHNDAITLDPLDLQPIDVNADQRKDDVQASIKNKLFDAHYNRCRYDAVFVVDIDSLDAVLAVMDDDVRARCTDTVVIALDIGTVSPVYYDAIQRSHLHYGIQVSNTYIETALSMIFAIFFMTAGQQIAVPRERNAYVTGPKLIAAPTADDTQAFLECQLNAFPVCPGPSAVNVEEPTLDTQSLRRSVDTETRASFVSTNNEGDTESLVWPNVVSPCPCLQRSNEIRLGAVLHGVTTDSFWDLVFDSAQQAALDMGTIQLEMDRITPQATATMVHELMAARIQNLCSSGVDGIMVTIPSDVVLPAIEYCLQSSIPVVSINSGLDTAMRLNQKYNTNATASGESLFLYHIGMNEFNAGYLAGQRMIEEGDMKYGYCIDHDDGNSATFERCRGFEQAILDSDRNVIFKARIAIPPDNTVEYKLVVEQSVQNDFKDTGIPANWDKIGFLLTGSVQVRAIRSTLGYGVGVGTEAVTAPIDSELPENRDGAIAATFDLSAEVYDAIEEGIILFGIDQQPYYQGNLPIHLLTYHAITQQQVLDFQMESGPSFVYSRPAESTAQCQANMYEVCPNRPYQEYNYISDAYFTFGYVLCGIIYAICIAGLIWTRCNIHLWVVQVSQPLFLAFIAIGTMISATSIVFMGNQTTYRNEQDYLGNLLQDETNPQVAFVDASCMAVPWLYGMGFVITFSALLAKIQRVKMIYEAGIQMKRRRVGMIHVFPIMFGMCVIELAILLSWQLISPLRWGREVLKEEGGFVVESIGSCSSGDDGWMFYLALVTFHVMCLIYALVLCFQTKNIGSDLAESNTISLAVMFMFQVLVLAVPILVLVRDTANVFFFVRAVAIFLQNFAVIVLIFAPKIMRTIWVEDTVPKSSYHKSSMNRQHSMHSVASYGGGGGNRPAISRAASFTSAKSGMYGGAPCFDQSQFGGANNNNRQKTTVKSSYMNDLHLCHDSFQEQIRRKHAQNRLRGLVSSSSDEDECGNIRSGADSHCDGNYGNDYEYDDDDMDDSRSFYDEGAEMTNHPRHHQSQPSGTTTECSSDSRSHLAEGPTSTAFFMRQLSLQNSSHHHGKDEPIKDWGTFSSMYYKSVALRNHVIHETIGTADDGDDAHGNENNGHREHSESNNINNNNDDHSVGPSVSNDEIEEQKMSSGTIVTNITGTRYFSRASSTSKNHERRSGVSAAGYGGNVREEEQPIMSPLPQRMIYDSESCGSLDYLDGSEEQQPLKQGQNLSTDVTPDDSMHSENGYETMYMPTEITSQWQSLGFESLEQAQMALQLMSLVTTPKTRRSLLLRDNADDTDTVDA